MGGCGFLVSPLVFIPIAVVSISSLGIRRGGGAERLSAVERTGTVSSTMLLGDSDPCRNVDDGVWCMEGNENESEEDASNGRQKVATLVLGAFSVSVDASYPRGFASVRFPAASTPRGVVILDTECVGSMFLAVL